MISSRPASAPFAHALREALESAVAPAVAEQVLMRALSAAGLEAVPEEVSAFRAFCHGPFRRVTVQSIGTPEQVFERVGHLLSMATGDASIMEVARSWSSPSPAPRGAREAERDEDSGVRHLDANGVPRTSASDSGPRSMKSSPTPGDEAQPERADRISDPGDESAGAYRSERVGSSPSLPATASTTNTLGRMRAVGSRGSQPRTDGRTDAHGETLPALMAVRPRVAPTTVLVFSLDPRFVSEVRQELITECPVRSIGEPTELPGAVATAGARIVVIFDAALPSIDVPTLVGLMPILPASTRVVLWGTTTRQRDRLATMFPAAASWTASDAADRPGQFVLTI